MYEQINAGVCQDITSAIRFEIIQPNNSETRGAKTTFTSVKSNSISGSRTLVPWNRWARGETSRSRRRRAPAVVWCKETEGKTHAGPKLSTIGCPAAERNRQLWEINITSYRDIIITLYNEYSIK
jgi:hypothetical protein